MRIFLGAPFTQHLNGSEFDKELKLAIESIIISLQKKGHVVKSAHVREKFGKELMTPDICTPLDFDEIKQCDLFIAIPSNPPSGGVHIELGWASAINKDIVLCMHTKGQYSPLIHGLDKISKSKKIVFENYIELVEKINGLVL
ncbi:MAG: hypothetical protein PHD05_00900 [Sphaerochaetaceae bacterium]|jgi:nucleoside 2-deoxyribosyltransferase|nr:hypothetical protein [Sphaerochaetaceae bacterium]